MEGDLDNLKLLEKVNLLDKGFDVIGGTFCKKTEEKVEEKIKN